MSDGAVQRFVDALTKARLEAEKRRGKTVVITELARRTGVSPQSVYAYFSGTTIPRTLLLENLLDVLEITGPERGRLATLRDDAELARRRRPKPGPSRPAAATVPHPVPREIPAHPGGFVGRTAELSRLTGLLAAHRTGRGPVVVAISGTAGVGKPAPGL